MPVIYKILDALTNKDEEIKEVNRQAEHISKSNRAVLLKSFLWIPRQVYLQCELFEL